MMQYKDLANTILGLDDDAYNSITRFWPPIVKFITTHLVPRTEYNFHELFQERRHLHSIFQSLEAEVTCRASPDFVTRQRGISRWRHDYLLPLAHDLKLAERVERSIIIRCLHRGWITQLAADAKISDEERRAVAIEQISKFLTKYPFPTGKHGHIKLLHSEGICPSSEAAGNVTREWAKWEKHAAAGARGAILDVTGAGMLGVLRVANYAYANEVLELQRIFENVPALRVLPRNAQAAVRQHIIALRQVLDQLRPELWRADLLHQPANNEVRREYGKRLTVGTRQLIDTALAAKLDIKVTSAASSFDALIS